MSTTLPTGVHVTREETEKLYEMYQKWKALKRRDEYSKATGVAQQEYKVFRDGLLAKYGYKLEDVLGIWSFCRVEDRDNLPEEGEILVRDDLPDWFTSGKYQMGYGCTERDD